jgi:hypothetical protein
MRLTNADGQPFRVCLTCDPPHVENCRTCFGWGVYPHDGKHYPISGSAMDDPDVREIAVPCPECGGTIDGGAPTDLRESIAAEEAG